MSSLPHTEFMPLRPIAARANLRAWRLEFNNNPTATLDPPSEAEIHDAILLLQEGSFDDVAGIEALRVLDEYGR